MTPIESRNIVPVKRNIQRGFTIERFIMPACPGSRHGTAACLDSLNSKSVHRTRRYSAGTHRDADVVSGTRKANTAFAHTLSQSNIYTENMVFPIVCVLVALVAPYNQTISPGAAPLWNARPTKTSCIQRGFRQNFVCGRKSSSNSRTLVCWAMPIIRSDRCAFYKPDALSEDNERARMLTMRHRHNNQ